HADLRRPRLGAGVRPRRRLRAPPPRHPAAGAADGPPRRSGHDADHDPSQRRARRSRGRPDGRHYAAAVPIAHDQPAAPSAAAPLTRPVRLDRLLDDVEVLELLGDPAATDVHAVAYDSRQSGPGTLFCSLPALVLDGHDFAAGAVRAGARAILCERFVPVDVVQVRVADARRSMAPIAAAFWDHPSRDLAVVGVTGTNGKTTTVHLLAAILEAGGR